MRAVIFNCVTWESTTSLGTSVQRTEGDRVGSKHGGYFLEEHSRQKEKQKKKSRAMFQAEENTNANA